MNSLTYAILCVGGPHAQQWWAGHCWTSSEAHAMAYETYGRAFEVAEEIEQPTAIEPHPQPQEVK